MAEFKFFCPRCGKQIQCDTSYCGTQINCPACQQPIVVPRLAPPAALPSARAKSKATRNVLTTGGLLIVLAGLITAGWFGYSRIKRGYLPYYVVSGAGTKAANGNYRPVTVRWATKPTWTIWANDNGQAYMGSHSGGGVYIWPNTGSNPGANQSYYVTSGKSPLDPWTRNTVGPGSDPPPTAILKH